MKNIFKIFGKIIIILFYFIISVIKFCTVKVILYDAPITGIYFATNLFNEKNLYEVKVSAAPFEPETGNIMVDKLLEMQK